MKSRRFSLPISLVFCLSLFSVSVLTKTGTAQTDTQNILFKGKRAIVKFVKAPTGSEEFGGTLNQVQVQKIGDRFFLVGKVADECNMKDHMIFVPLDYVTLIVELDSAEITRAASQASQADMQNGLFKEKRVLVGYVRHSKGVDNQFEQVQAQKIGDRYFLGGKVVDEKSDMKGRIVWLPLDKVAGIVKMDVEGTGNALEASEKGIRATAITPRTQQ